MYFPPVIELLGSNKIILVLFCYKMQENGRELSNINIKNKKIQKIPRKLQVRFIGHMIRYHIVRNKEQTKKGGIFMKGYFVADGYMGYVDGRYMLFADEDDYREYISE